MGKSANITIFNNMRKELNNITRFTETTLQVCEQKMTKNIDKRL